MKTARSRRQVCAFESLEGRELTASIYIKVDGVDGRVVAQQRPAEVVLTDVPPTALIGLLLPAVQKVR